MNTIVCLQKWAPMRLQATSTSEMVSCMLFGETATVIEETNEWYKVQMHYDNYQGWIGKEYVHPATGISAQAVNCSKNTYYKDKFGKIEIPVGGHMLGSSLQVQHNVFELVSDANTTAMVNPKWIGPSALYHFLHTPYLWGGRSTSGIDCSGLVQVCLKMAGMQAPRDASEQYNLGVHVEYEQIDINDLVFFVKNNKIHHVGIALGKGQIIHASGRVRVDELRPEGIFNIATQQISHVFAGAKRVITNT